MTKNTTDKTQCVAKESEFKGKPVLALYRSEGDKYPLKFGLAKAALILAHVEAIKAFYGKHQGKEATAAA